MVTTWRPFFCSSSLRWPLPPVDFKARAQHYNLSIAKKEALTRISKCGDMVIKPVDKGGAVVVWSHLLYLVKANPQLSNGRFCKHLDHDPLKESQNMVISTIFEMISDNQRPPSAPSRFYMYLLPMIHKAGNPGRPNNCFRVLLSHRKHSFLLGSDYVSPCAQP